MCVIFMCFFRSFYSVDGCNGEGKGMAGNREMEESLYEEESEYERDGNGEEEEVKWAYTFARLASNHLGDDVEVGDWD